MNPLIQLRKKCLVCLAVLACYGLSPALNANTIKVSNTNDSGPGSLRDALAVAINGDTINATDVSGTILLTSGALQITHSVRINGPGAGNLAVNGNATSAVFENFANRVAISGFTITNSRNGPGIHNLGGLTVKNSSVVKNTDSGIFNHGTRRVVTLTITNCTISGNSASNGGGIHNEAISVGGDGSATVAISNSTISGNSASNGGGIYNSSVELYFIPNVSNATVAIRNSTLGGNNAGQGGAIFNNAGPLSHFGNASVSVKNSTISGNWATGGGIYNSTAVGHAELELGSTILKAGSSGHNILNHGGTVTSLGYNLATDNGGGFLTGPGDQINTLPRLGPLQNNGGPTFTRALLPGSPAINAGNPNFAPPPSFDQRGPGYPRLVNGRIDIGSFEVQPTPTPTPTAP